VAWLHFAYCIPAWPWALLAKWLHFFTPLRGGFDYVLRHTVVSCEQQQETGEFNNCRRVSVSHWHYVLIFSSYVQLWAVPVHLATQRLKLQQGPISYDINHSSSKIDTQDDYILQQ
jgi:hypothetical protein